MNIEEFNQLKKRKAREELFKCCGSTTWANRMIDLLPFRSVNDLKSKSDRIWWECNEEDWKEAFSQHPKIGERKIEEKKFTATKSWAEDEQSGVKLAEEKVITKLAEANLKYEKKFGYIFIVCATGKTADEMLDIVNERSNNNPMEEIKIAASEQNKITHLRIDKLIS